MTLSLKQMEVIRLVSLGMKNKEIAEFVGNTEHVIKNYLRVIYDETGMWNRTELALWYISRESPTQAPVKPFPPDPFFDVWEKLGE